MCYVLQGTQNIGNFNKLLHTRLLPSAAKKKGAQRNIKCSSMALALNSGSVEERVACSLILWMEILKHGGYEAQAYHVYIS